MAVQGSGRTELVWTAVRPCTGSVRAGSRAPKMRKRVLHLNSARLWKAPQLARPKVTVRNPGVKSPKDCCQDSLGQ
jgi:hypothetical protein